MRCGYLTAFNGLDLGTEPTKDAEEYKVSVYTPFNAEAPEYTQAAPAQNDDGLRTVDCIGIIEHFSWGGGAGDPICIGAYVSTEFANQLKAKQKTTLTTTAIKKLGWWVVNYDVENKAWFEEAFPKTADGFVAGQLNAAGRQGGGAAGGRGADPDRPEHRRAGVPDLLRDRPGRERDLRAPLRPGQDQAVREGLGPAGRQDRQGQAERVT